MTSRTIFQISLAIGVNVAFVVIWHTFKFLTDKLNTPWYIALSIAMIVEIMYVWFPIIENKGLIQSNRLLKYGIFFVSVIPVSLSYGNKIWKEIETEIIVQPPIIVEKSIFLVNIESDLKGLREDIIRLQKQEDDYISRRWYGNARKIRTEKQLIRQEIKSKSSKQYQEETLYSAAEAHYQEQLIKYNQIQQRPWIGKLFDYLILIYVLIVILVLQLRNGELVTIASKLYFDEQRKGIIKPPANYKGVSLDKSTNRYSVTYKGAYIGSSSSQESMAKLYDYVLIKTQGNLKRRNYPSISENRLIKSISSNIKEKVAVKIQKIIGK